MAKQEAKREAVFEAASDVFSKYGFRRTSMNDIAEAAGISRPALYLMFENKEDLFRQLASQRQNQAIDEAFKVLSGKGPLVDRFIGAFLAYEKKYYEPVSGSPHGEELMDINLSIAGDDMKKGRDRLMGFLAKAIDDAVSKGEADLSGSQMTSRDFVELYMSSIGGQKKSATSIKDFRRRISEVGAIFMASITPPK